jgi:asparagine synthase (glutamine-hydrolysing)
MCGITGLLEFNSSPSDDLIIRKMTRALAHRGPDAEGIWTEDEIAVGHCRLSIIDLSAAANQPFPDNSGRYIIVFNGEVYNYNEVKAQLHGYAFKTTSDTEAIIAAYAKWGVHCVNYFKGMFAFAIWDREQKELFIARDRLGVKPLYYHIDDKHLIFASEVRAILASGLVRKKLDKHALTEYFTYQSVTSPLSLIEDIRQLEAGCYLTLKKRQLTINRYWKVSNCAVSNDYGNEAIIKKNIFQLLGKSVERRLVSDVPVAAFLSGGIDSGVVVGLMAEYCKVKPATFNISFSEEAYDESKYAETVSRKFNTEHRRIDLSPETMLDQLEMALSALDTPSGDGINSYVVSKAIRKEGIKVALSGIGGDELFAGYPVFDQYKKLHAQSRLWKHSALLRKLAAALLPRNGFSNKTLRLKQLLNVPVPDIAHVYPLLRQMLPPVQQKQLLRLNSSQKTMLEDMLLDNLEGLNSLPVLSQVTAAEYYGYTQNTLLKDTDQMSMAVALEVREPFFDSDLIEYVIGIPDQFKEPVYPKSLLVESVKPLLPDEVVFRKKQGFVFPWELWMKNELYSFCDQHISRMAERDFIHAEALRHFWKRFLSNQPGIRWMDIWLFVVLEYWLEKNGIED